MLWVVVCVQVAANEYWVPNRLYAGVYDGKRETTRKMRGLDVGQSIRESLGVGRAKEQLRGNTEELPRCVHNAEDAGALRRMNRTNLSVEGYSSTSGPQPKPRRL